MHHQPTPFHEIVLALFKYGLATEPHEVAIAMEISDEEAERMCDDLVEAGLLAAG